MIHQITEIIQHYGSLGLFTSMALEGSSLPFPGLPVVLALGNILAPKLSDILWFSIGMSFTYSLASLIPYYIGLKFQSLVTGKFSSQLSKIQTWFNKYGEWSICLSRPFGVGNYISYAAGISRTNLAKYVILTFLGIFPWAFSILYIATGF